VGFLFYCGGFFQINYFHPVTLVAAPWGEQQLSLQWQVVPPTTQSQQRHGDRDSLPWFWPKSKKALFKHKQRKDPTAPAALTHTSLEQGRSERAQTGKPCIFGSTGLASVNPAPPSGKLVWEHYWLESVSSQRCCNAAHAPSTAIQHASCWTAGYCKLIQDWVWPISVRTEEDEKGSAQPEHGYHSYILKSYGKKTTRE